MQPENLASVLRQHPFLGGLSDQHLDILIGCASNAHYPEGTHLLREGESANKLFLIRSGRVALQMDVPPRGSIRIQTVGPGEVLGWSWLVFPFRWHFDGFAVTDVRAFVLDGNCLKTKCDNDHDFGYEMLSRLSGVMQQRVEATRLQLLDLYGTVAEAEL